MIPGWLTFLWGTLSAFGSTETLLEGVQAIAKAKPVYALVRKVCAPWDGPAVSFTFSKNPLDCDKRVYPEFAVTIFRSLGKGPHSIVLSNGGKEGVVAYCPKAHQCQPLERAHLNLESFGTGPVPGNVKVFSKDRPGVSFSFKAKWCAERALCG